jgi:uncharacterized NAD-dependent epimerase/dehydratase family protein
MPKHPLYRPNDKLVLLMHDGLTSDRGKTGLVLLRFAPERVVAVIDQKHPGGSLRELTGIPLKRDIPIVKSTADALQYQPDTLAIGIAPGGGKLPEEWFVDIEDAVRGGLNVLNGLHVKLNEDSRVRKHLRDGQWVWDIRQEPPNLSVANGAARLLDCKRVLFVGTDMSIGKMSAAVMFDRAAAAAGIRSKFMATGQTGIMLAGDGIPLDAVRIDFAGGAVQQEVIECALGNDVVWVEGQGSFLNPASTATLPLLRGSQATHMVLVHKSNRTHIRFTEWARIPALRDVIQMYETVAHAGGTFAPTKVACIALNTHGLSDAEVRYEIAKTEAETGLPTDDVVRHGAEKLLESIMSPVRKTGS